MEIALKEGPAAALRWAPRRPDLMAAAAEARADEAKDRSDYAAAADQAREALRRGPLENTALLVLALDADRLSQHERAAELMSVIGARTRRDVQSQLWLAEHALKTADYPQAFLHLDMALRRDATLGPVVFPVMIDAVADRGAAGPLAARLAKSPSWRTPFVTSLAETAAPDETEAVLRALRATGGAPTDAEVAGLLKTRLAQGDYVGARRSWFGLLPAASARSLETPYDGAFRGLPGAPPFNWRLTIASGVVSEIAQAPDGRHALHLQYSPARRRVLAEQLIALPPGAYRLTGEARGGGGATADNLAWRLSCVHDQGDFFAEARVGAEVESWRSFSLTFEVPAAGCDAQWLRLANGARDSFDSEEVWLAALRIDKF